MKAMELQLFTYTFDSLFKLYKGKENQSAKIVFKYKDSLFRADFVYDNLFIKENAKLIFNEDLTGYFKLGNSMFESDVLNDIFTSLPDSFRQIKKFLSTDLEGSSKLFNKSNCSKVIKNVDFIYPNLPTLDFYIFDDEADFEPIAFISDDKQV